MKTLEELKTLYEEKLVPELEILEKQRKKICEKLFFYGAVIFAVVLPVTVIAKHFFPVIIGILIFAGIAYFSTRGYLSKFKTAIIALIIKGIDENLTYTKFRYIPKSTFSASKIFLHSIDEYTGDDHVEGKIEKTAIEFSELHAQYVVHTKNGRQYHTIFKGLFIAADFNKNFKGTTVILPDLAEKLFGNIGTFMQSMNKTRGELIKLEDPEFERYFAVYGRDQIQARYLLSTSLMKRIVDFKKRSGKSIYMSFVDSKIFIAIPYSRNLFEPRIFRTLINFQPIKQYYDDLKLATDVVEELNLNTRIWGK
jgi:hypothetical protein